MNLVFNQTHSVFIAYTLCFLRAASCFLKFLNVIFSKTKRKSFLGKIRYIIFSILKIIPLFEGFFT